MIKRGDLRLTLGTSSQSTVIVVGVSESSTGVGSVVVVVVECHLVFVWFVGCLIK